ncbi:MULTISPECIES: hypothetical protein [unclassified Enterococcus]|uniref:hypothetical protein n=1 Tax=unclassified Enterococcus TaxID=2608891 RepID=UPI0013EA04B9|nr:MULTISPECIES: hypothetical protein [unclassified Enterococcus]
MNNETIILGKKYACQPIGLKKTVIGEVISKLENCVVICVEEYEECDHGELLEKCGKVVAKYSHVYELENNEYVYEYNKKYEHTLVS